MPLNNRSQRKQTDFYDDENSNFEIMNNRDQTISHHKGIIWYKVI